MMKTVVATSSAALALISATDVNAQTAVRQMSFANCLALIRATAADLRTAPINIVETKNVRIVRFPTADGSVLLTCSGPDQKMIAKVTKR